MDKATTKRAIADALRVVRKERGLSQAEAAKQLSTTPVTISRWENAVRTPNAVDLANLAEAYDTTPDVFYATVLPTDPLAEAEHALTRARAILRTQRLAQKRATREE